MWWRWNTMVIMINGVAFCRNLKVNCSTVTTRPESSSVNGGE